MVTLRTPADFGGRVTMSLPMLLGKRDQCPIGVGVWLSVPCVFSRLARSLALRLRRNRILSRNRKKRRQSLRHLHPLHLYLRRLQVGSNRWWRASQRCSAIQRRRAAFKAWSVSPLLLIATAEL